METIDVAASMESALEHQRAGRLAEAEALYRGVLKAEPENAEALHLYGCLALQARWPDIATKAIERAISVNGRNPDYHVSLGQARLQVGDQEKALAAFRAATALDPQSSVGHFLIGFALAGRGDMAGARAAYEAALQAQPDFPQALFNLGALLQSEGDRAGAAARYRRALELMPEFAEAHLNLGICLAEAGDFKAAISALERAVALQPKRAGAHDALGNAFVEVGEPERAVASYRRALALEPDVASVHFNLGNAFRKLERFEAALMAYNDALNRNPKLVDAFINAGSISHEMGRRDDAERLFRQALAIDPRAAHAEAGLGLVLRLKGDVTQALAATERGVALDPKAPDVQIALGTVLQDFGRFEEAEAAFRRALAVKPDSPTALYHLANMGEGELNDAELARMEGMLTQGGLARDTRVGLNFGLGKAFDRRGDYDRAFLHFRQGNEMKAAQHPFDAANFERQVDDLISIFDAAFFAARKDFGLDSERPIFVLGMQRSGSTLIEQILAAHPDVHAAGELRASFLLLEELEHSPAVAATGRHYPFVVPALDRNSVQKLGAFFLEQLGKGAGDALRVTDKATGNFLHLGLIALLLPRARVIHCQRDPIDTCISCYFQNFLEPIPFVYTLDRLGAYYRAYERLMAHWRKLKPLPLLEIPYEALVAEPEPWTRRILDFCGLPWNDASLRFFGAERAVQTASYWQVRQPIYQSSVARWRHYQKHLGPLFAALGRSEADAG